MFLFKIKLIVKDCFSPPLVVRNKIFRGSITTKCGLEFLNKKCVSDKEERRQRGGRYQPLTIRSSVRYYMAYVCRWRNADPAAHTPLFSPET